MAESKRQGAVEVTISTQMIFYKSNLSAVKRTVLAVARSFALLQSYPLLTTTPHEVLGSGRSKGRLLHHHRAFREDYASNVGPPATMGTRKCPFQRVTSRSTQLSYLPNFLTSRAARVLMSLSPLPLICSPMTRMLKLESLVAIPGK